MIRRFGEPPHDGIKYTLRPGAYAILQQNDRILLTFQDSPFLEFQLPGGGIDPNENVIHALRREILEETGYTIGAPRKIGAFRRFVHMPEYNIWAEKLCHIYYARPALKRRFHLLPMLETDTFCAAHLDPFSWRILVKHGRHIIRKRRVICVC
jgi:8-oxo-dGTP diphosphatase